MAIRKKSKHIGSSVEDLLKEDGILEAATDAAVKAVIAWQITQEMKRQSVTKTAMAKWLGTSRAQLNRTLSPDYDKVTVETLKKMADKLGKQLIIKLA
jgi:antitoxin HicB